MAEHRALAGIGVPARAPRAIVFAAVSACLALAAHTAGGGGHPPSAVVVVVIAVGLMARVSYGLAGRERGFAEITIGIGAGQVLLHVAFTLATPDLAAHAVAAPGGHGHSGASASSTATAILPGVPMMLAHALAAGITVIAFRRAERILWSTMALRSWLAGAPGSVAAAAISRLGRILAVLWVPTTPTQRPRAQPISTCPNAPSHAEARIGRTSRRRGPPGRPGASSAVLVAVSLGIALTHG